MNPSGFPASPCTPRLLSSHFFAAFFNLCEINICYIIKVFRCFLKNLNRHKNGQIWNDASEKAELLALYFKASQSPCLICWMACSLHIIQVFSFFCCQVFPFSPRQLVKGLLLPLGPTAHFLLSPAPVPIWQSRPGSWKLGAEPSAAQLCTILPPNPSSRCIHPDFFYFPALKHTAALRNGVKAEMDWLANPKVTI